MDHQDSEMRPFSRRDFLKAAGLTIGGALITACAQSQESDSLSPTPTSSGGKVRTWRVNGIEVDQLSAFDGAMKAFMQSRDIPAGALAVVRDGKLVFARGYSWSTQDNIQVEPVSLFRLSSLGKTITAAGILLLVQEGKLSLCDKVIEILPLLTLSLQAADARLREITIQNLLQNQGGWDRQTTFDPLFHDHAIASSLQVHLPLTPSDIIRYMAGKPLQFQPGERFSDSHYGYMLLGRVIEAVSGVSYEEFIQANLLQALGIRGMRLGRTLAEYRAPGEMEYHSNYLGVTVMDDSGRAVPLPYGAFNVENMDSCAGWLASAVDLARWLASFRMRSVSSDKALQPVLAHPLLSPESLEAMFAVPASGIHPTGWYYGCGWYLMGEGSYQSAWMNGVLPGTYARMERRVDGLSYVALFNQSEDPEDPDGSRYADIEWRMRYAFANVKKWPDMDLFEQL